MASRVDSDYTCSKRFTESRYRGVLIEVWMQTAPNKRQYCLAVPYLLQYFIIFMVANNYNNKCKLVENVISTQSHYKYYCYQHRHRNKLYVSCQLYAHLHVYACNKTCICNILMSIGRYCPRTSVFIYCILFNSSSFRLLMPWKCHSAFYIPWWVV